MAIDQYLDQDEGSKSQRRDDGEWAVDNDHVPHIHPTQEARAMTTSPRDLRAARTPTPPKTKDNFGPLAWSRTMANILADEFFEKLEKEMNFDSGTTSLPLQDATNGQSEHLCPSMLNFGVQKEHVRRESQSPSDQTPRKSQVQSSNDLPDNTTWAENQRPTRQSAEAETVIQVPYQNHLLLVKEASPVHPERTRIPKPLSPLRGAENQKLAKRPGDIKETAVEGSSRVHSHFIGKETPDIYPQRTQTLKTQSPPRCVGNKRPTRRSVEYEKTFAKSTSQSLARLPIPGAGNVHPERLRKLRTLENPRTLERKKRKRRCSRRHHRDKY